jgi:hypothetical protein
VGLLWTPPWWGWNNGAYVFNEGYWGPTVGFYGGINYGYGYFGSGYSGGYWEGNTFHYNTAVTRVNAATIHNTFVDRSALSKQVTGNRASFNGPNGVKAEATAAEKAAAENAQKTPPTSQQVARREAASKDHNLQASVNHGQPNADTMKSFNKSAENANSAQGPETGAAKSGNKTENTSVRKTAGTARERASGHGVKNYARGRNVNGHVAPARFGKTSGHQHFNVAHHTMTRRSAHMGMETPHQHGHPQDGGSRGHGSAHQQSKHEH